MNWRGELDKFKKHYRSGGLLYAGRRGIQYGRFRIRERSLRRTERVEIALVTGALRLVCEAPRLRIFWDGRELTKELGLNVWLMTAGIWTDSARASWEVIENDGASLKIKLTFRCLPLYQIWTLRIADGHEIEWDITMHLEEWLHLDEMRIQCQLAPQHKEWFSDYLQAAFPAFGNAWTDLFTSPEPASFVGVRFSLHDACLPSLGWEALERYFLPLVQKSQRELGIHQIGFRRVDHPERKEYLPGEYPVFHGKIRLFDKEQALDEKIEGLRRSHLHRMVQKKSSLHGTRRAKVLLVNLPWQKNGITGVRAGSRWPHLKDASEGDYLPFPFFLAYATALLEKNGLDVLMIDAIAEGMSEATLLDKIMALNADYVVAETSVPSFRIDMGQLRRIADTGISIILCGPHSEIYTNEFLQDYPFIHFVLYGEYEFTLLELLQTLQQGGQLGLVKGIIYRCGSQVVKNPPREPADVNCLPWPHRESLPIRKYWDSPGGMPYPSVQMLASRGCPYGCTFCLWPQVLYGGRHYRPRDVEDVLNEMEYLVREKGFKSVYFDDDTFNIGKERMLCFCRGLTQRGLQHIPWAIMARADLMDKEILTKMKSAGLWAVKYGVESQNSKIIAGYQKHLDLAKATRMITLTRELGIKVHLTFSFGGEGETLATIDRSIAYAFSLDPYSIQFSILTPFPGTAAYLALEKEGRILTREWEKYDGHYHCVFAPKSLTSGQLVNAKIKAYRLWADHLRKKRGLGGDIQRFRQYLREKGLGQSLRKTADYMGFLLLKRHNYLAGKDCSRNG